MLTFNEQKMLKIIRDVYAGIAETSNIQYSVRPVAWTPRQVAGIGRSLKKKGLIDITQDGGAKTLEGGVGSYYMIPREKSKSNQKGYE